MLRVDVALPPEQVNSWETVELGSQSTVELFRSVFVSPVSSLLPEKSLLVNEDLNLQSILEPSGTEAVKEVFVVLADTYRLSSASTQLPLSILYSIS